MSRSRSNKRKITVALLGALFCGVGGNSSSAQDTQPTTSSKAPILVRRTQPQSSLVRNAAYGMLGVGIAGGAALGVDKLVNGPNSIIDKALNGGKGNNQDLQAKCNEQIKDLQAKLDEQVKNSAEKETQLKNATEQLTKLKATENGSQNVSNNEEIKRLQELVKKLRAEQDENLNKQEYLKSKLNEELVKQKQLEEKIAAEKKQLEEEAAKKEKEEREKKAKEDEEKAKKEKESKDPAKKGWTFAGAFKKLKKTIVEHKFDSLKESLAKSKEENDKKIEKLKEENDKKVEKLKEQNKSLSDQLKANDEQTRAEKMAKLEESIFISNKQKETINNNINKIKVRAKVLSNRLANYKLASISGPYIFLGNDNVVINNDELLIGRNAVALFKNAKKYLKEVNAAKAFVEAAEGNRDINEFNVYLRYIGNDDFNRNSIDLRITSLKVGQFDSEYENLGKLQNALKDINDPYHYKGYDLLSLVYEFMINESEFSKNCIRFSIVQNDANDLRVDWNCLKIINNQVMNDGFITGRFKLRNNNLDDMKFFDLPSAPSTKTEKAKKILNKIGAGFSKGIDKIKMLTTKDKDKKEQMKAKIKSENLNRKFDNDSKKAEAIANNAGMNELFGTGVPKINFN